MSLGQAVIATDEFKSFAANKISKPDIIELESTLAAIRLQTPFSIYNALPHIPVSSNLVFGVREAGFVSGIVEAASKPKTDLGFESVAYSVCSITAQMKMPRELLDNALGIAAHIDTKLYYDLINKIDWQLISGNGSNGNSTELSGLMQPENHAVYTPTAGDTLIDAINRAKYLLWSKGWLADKAFVNPMDWGAVEMAKDSNGHYIYGLPGTLIKTNVLGIEIIPNSWVPQGEFIIGAFNRAVTIWDIGNVTVEIKFDEPNRKLINVCISVQLAFEISTPSAILAGKFAD